MATPKILIIDDEKHMCWALEKAMRQEGYIAISASNGMDGLKKIKDEMPSLVILDLKMPGMDGMQVLKKAREINPRLPVIILTAHGTIDTAIEAMKMGAVDYVTKPFDLVELNIMIKQHLAVTQLQTEVNFLRSELAKKYGNIIGQSTAIREVIQIIEQVAKTSATVLITGESGTGKEVAALSIHHNSPRCEAPFVPVNCAALPEQLLESELFGHEKGAFTGASSRKPGRFELANGGTIFLDEIAEMPPNMQAKLLRILQEKTFERVGGTETLRVDVRVIAATNRDLRQLIREGLFREDLFYRLNVVQIHLPPLRERREDIPLLVEHFIQKFGTAYKVNSISPEAMSLLEQYDWPGNVRELQNIVERASIICRGHEIQPEHLPSEIQRIHTQKRGIIIRFPDQGLSMEQLEKELIVKALEKSGGNQTKAAKLLGISRSAFLYRSQKHGIF
ncbi:sigma-54-dependent Fis family transcriptional regulator [Desulfallas sp. Bu1-1]|uniref:sigma-54-dependent transcriptional regulator n=1 Tax=Desulfallas sp. Bu1-1 TaxID=2787620 RepID=UPI00189E9396|nr:sigma-54 dependent transcriptional regulator [Desulfallas sp. Bu1-1]MBF7084567.1 sigma-54-dependent Fis family transcriptional regulator [Desulfallas sp. Bu1-1]